MEEDIIKIIEKCKKSRLPEGEKYIFGKEALLQEDIKVLEEYIKEQEEFKKQFNLEEIEERN